MLASARSRSVDTNKMGGTTVFVVSMRVASGVNVFCRVLASKFVGSRAPYDVPHAVLRVAAQGATVTTGHREKVSGVSVVSFARQRRSAEK